MSANHRDKRRPRLPLMEIQQGQVAFRLVSHVSKIGPVIGRSGSVISAIRRDTACIIHCEDLVEGSQHRAILVAGSASPERTIRLGGVEEEEEEVLVSRAQGALVGVLERMWQLDARKGGVVGNEGYCGLLVHRTQIGAVVGREGRNIIRMKRGSGAMIRTLPAPLCGSQDDELIQITGTILAVKKAVIDVTTCLQDCPPYENNPMPLTRLVSGTSSGDSSDSHAEFFPHLCSLLPTFTERSANAKSLSSDGNGGLNEDAEAKQQVVLFRMLFPHRAAGSIIGKAGTIVRALEKESGASIRIDSHLTKSNERLAIISALENLESWHSPAQNAVVLVFARSVEHKIENGNVPVFIEGTSVTARLVVASDIVFCLRGKGEGIDSEMIETTGADIQISEGEQVLDCASKNDVVVQITGGYTSVQNALFQVTGKLRIHHSPTEVHNELWPSNHYGRARDITYSRLHQSAGQSLGSNQATSLVKQMDQRELSNSMGDSPKKLGRGHISGIADSEKSSATSAKVSELGRALHFLLPREVA